MEVSRNLSDNYKNIEKVTFIDVTKVFYPIAYLLSKQRVFYDESESLNFDVLPEDLDYTVSSKNSDSGQIFDLRVKLEVFNQSEITEKALESYLNKKVIVILHYAQGQMIFGCNNFGLKFLYTENNTTSPSGNNGYTIECRGNSYLSKITV